MEITNTNGRIIVIGDLHGMYDETIELLDKCQITDSDTLIFLGDLVDRGPDNGKCVDFVMNREKVQGAPACILGNHEDRHLSYYSFDEKGQTPNISSPFHVATRLQLTKEHYEYFKKLPLYIKLPQYNAICVHAGVFPGRPIEAQDRHNLLHIQCINPTKHHKTSWPSKVPKGEEGWKFWTHFFSGPERIIFGHSVLDKPLITEFAVGIDGGAVFGRQHHALILPDWRIVSVTSNNDFGRGRRGTQSENVKKFLIHGDISTYS